MLKNEFLKITKIAYNTKWCLRFHIFIFSTFLNFNKYIYKKITFKTTWSQNWEKDISMCCIQRIIAWVASSVKNSQNLSFPQIFLVLPSYDSQKFASLYLPHTIFDWKVLNYKVVALAKIFSMTCYTFQLKVFWPLFLGFLMVENQISSLIIDIYFGSFNLSLKSPNEKCKFIFYI